MPGTIRLALPLTLMGCGALPCATPRAFACTSRGEPVSLLKVMDVILCTVRRERETRERGRERECTVITLWS